MPSVRSGRYSPGPMAGSSSGQNRLFQYSCAAGEGQEEPNFLATVSKKLLFLHFIPNAVIPALVLVLIPYHVRGPVSQRFEPLDLLGEFRRGLVERRFPGPVRIKPYEDGAEQ